MRLFLRAFLTVIVLSNIVFTFLPQRVFAQTPTVSCVRGPNGVRDPKCIQVDETQLGFKIPTLADILTFAIRGFFVIAGITALIFLLLGAFAWITSGGDKEAVGAAQQKIQAALLGVILIAVVLALVVTFEQVVFRGTICFGISCPVSIPGLVKPCNEAAREGTPCSGSGASSGQGSNSSSSGISNANGDTSLTPTGPYTTPTLSITPTAIQTPDASIHPYNTNNSNTGTSSNSSSSTQNSTQTGSTSITPTPTTKTYPGLPNTGM